MFSIPNCPAPTSSRSTYYDRHQYNSFYSSNEDLITELAVKVIILLIVAISPYLASIGNAVWDGAVTIFNKVCRCLSSDEESNDLDLNFPLVNYDVLDYSQPSLYASPTPPARPQSEDLHQNRQYALSRLKEIKNKLLSDHPPQFKTTEQIMQFNLDDELARYDKNTPIQNLLGLLDYAGPSPIEARAGRLSALEEQIDRRDKLSEHLLLYPVWIEGRRRTVRESLGQLSHIWSEKKRKIAQQPFPTESLRLTAVNDLKTEIRTHCEAINNAHNNCIDQVSGQIQSFLLDVISSELNSRGQISKTQVQAGLTLFKYRSRLIEQMISELYPHEIHMADLERMVLDRSGSRLGLNGNIVLLGAEYGYMVQDADIKIARVTQAVFNRYHSSNGSPFAFLLRELKTYAGANLTRNLRTVMIQQVNESLSLDSAYDEDYEVADPLVKEIIQVASREEEDVFQFLTASDAGIVWLMEEAGLIREI